MEEKKKPTVIVIPATKPGMTSMEVPNIDVKWEDVTEDYLADIFVEYGGPDAKIAMAFGVTKEDVAKKRKSFGLTQKEIARRRVLGKIRIGEMSNE